MIDKTNQKKKINDDGINHRDINKFAETFTRNNPGLAPGLCHSIYKLETVDIDGNVTSTRFGINLMTDYGLKQKFTTSSSFNSRIFVGQGQTDPTFDNKSIYDQLFGTYATSVSRSKDIGDVYDKSTDMYTSRKLVAYGYFDYNISGVTEDKTIYEVGLGDTATTLISHAKIYDESGQVSYIVKHPNERLYISAYWSMSIKMAEITNRLWDNGVYGVLSPRHMLLSWSPYVYNILQNDYHTYTTTSTDGYHYADVADGVVTLSGIRLGSELISNKYDYFNRLMQQSASSWYDSNYRLFRYLRMDEPEEIVCDTLRTNYLSSRSFSWNFGMGYGDHSEEIDGHIPVNDFKIKSLYAYNHFTKEWDIDEMDQIDYTEGYDYGTRMIPIGYEYMHSTITDTDVTVYIYIHTATDYPISRFTNPGTTVYCTDSWWDTDSWQVIPDVSNIPKELGSKRYFITEQKRMTSTGHTLPYHAIFTKPITTLSWSGSSCHRISSDKYGWIIRDNTHFYFPDDGALYTYAAYNNNSPNRSIRFKNKDGSRVFVPIYRTYTQSGARIYDLSGGSSQTPTFYDVVVDETPTSGQSIYMTNTSYGYIVWYNDSTHKTYVLDMNGSEETSFVPTVYAIEKTTYFATAMDISNYCVYQTVDTDVSTFEIMDLQTHEIIDTFSLDNKYTISSIVGWRDFVYIIIYQNNVYSGFGYDLTKEPANRLTMLNFDSDIYPIFVNTSMGDMQETNEECMIRYSSSKILVMTYDDPFNPKIVSSASSVSYVVLEYVNDGRQLIAVVSRSTNYGMFVINLGLFIDSGSYYNPSGIINDTYTEAVYYDGYLYEFSPSGTMLKAPIECGVQHKITLDTYTIQSYNNPKRVGPFNMPSIKITNRVNNE